MDGRYVIRDQTKMNCYDRVCDLGQWAERVSPTLPPLSCYRYRPCSRCWLCSRRHVTLAHVSSSLPPRHPSPDNVYKSNIVTRQRAAHTMPFCWAKSLNHSSQSIRICFRDTRAPVCLQILTCCVYTYVNSSSVLPNGWMNDTLSGNNITF